MYEGVWIWGEVFMQIVVVVVVVLVIFVVVVAVVQEDGCSRKMNKRISIS